MSYGANFFKGSMDMAFGMKNSQEFVKLPEDVRNVVNGGPIKIKNKYFNSYLKLSNSTDWSGDRTLWGGDPKKPTEEDSKPDRFLWHIYQVDANQGIPKCFIIQNVRFGQCLKAGWKADSNGDHENYGNNVDKGVEKADKERFFFRLDRVGDNTYTINSERFGGAPWKLGWGEDDGDRKAYCSNPDKGIEEESSERFYWVLEPAKFTF